ncbi:hypothetical protein CF166_09580 [Amycolatopsis sp. KNN50.9b]|nr:hypothetical protein CF166_09580 [Amycolatopsis sp. KNN50.9b]
MDVAGLPGRRGVDVASPAQEARSAGSGGRPATAAVLASAPHGITADAEVLPSARVNECLARGDVRYRFVLDPSDLD